MNQTTVPALWWGWLLAMCAFIALMSLAFIFLPDAMMATTSETYLGAADAHLAFGAEGAAYLRFALGTGSAISIAWMVAVALVVLGPFRRGERWAWNLVALSVGTWFLFDGVNSVLSGFAENALYNLVFLIGFAVPLAATFSRFRRV